jgi:hypothetical protein
MVLKKVLGFVTTTSLILLVMIAPTTSLRQEDNDNETAAAVNATTADEPNIPIGPAEEEEVIK